MIEKNLKETSELFDKDLLKIQDAIVLNLNGYTLNCNDGSSKKY